MLQLWKSKWYNIINIYKYKYLHITADGADTSRMNRIQKGVSCTKFTLGCRWGPSIICHVIWSGSADTGKRG